MCHTLCFYHLWTVCFACIFFFQCACCRSSHHSVFAAQHSQYPLLIFCALAITFVCSLHSRIYWCLHNSSTIENRKYIGKFDWKIYVTSVDLIVQINTHTHTQLSTQIDGMDNVYSCRVQFDVTASIGMEASTPLHDVTETISERNVI